MKRLSLLLLVLLLLSPALSWGERVLTDEQYSELLTLLERQENTLNEQRQTIENLESELNRANEALSQAQTLQDLQKERIAMLSQTISELGKSLEQLRSGILGVEGGLTFDGKLGFYAGINYRF